MKIVSTFVLSLQHEKIYLYEWTMDFQRVIQFKIVSILKIIGVNTFCNRANNFVCLSFQKIIFLTVLVIQIELTSKSFDPNDETYNNFACYFKKCLGGVVPEGNSSR